MSQSAPGETGKIILLNGASSSGKSTLARALQAALPTPFLHVSSDQLIDGGAVPKRAGFDWVGSMRPRFFDGFHRSVAGMAAAGNDLIVDHIIEYPSWRAQLADVLSGMDVFLVAVHCDPDELERRERERTDRTPGEAMAHLLQNRIHDLGPVDLSVDTTSGIDDALAHGLISSWTARRPPGALFARSPSGVGVHQE